MMRKSLTQGRKRREGANYSNHGLTRIDTDGKGEKGAKETQRYSKCVPQSRLQTGAPFTGHSLHLFLAFILRWRDVPIEEKLVAHSLVSAFFGQERIIRRETHRVKLVRVHNSP